MVKVIMVAIYIAAVIVAALALKGTIETSIRSSSKAIPVELDNAILGINK